MLYSLADLQLHRQSRLHEVVDELACCTCTLQTPCRVAAPLSLACCVPAQHINILTLGSPTGTGVFFPNGLNGVIKTPAGFNLTDAGTASFYKAVPSGQARKSMSAPAATYKQGSALGLVLRLKALLLTFHSPARSANAVPGALH